MPLVSGRQFAQINAKYTVFYQVLNNTGIPGNSGAVVSFFIEGLYQVMFRDILYFSYSFLSRLR
jgi:hypothetical protein